MYEIDEQDRVVQLKDVPQFSVGSPMPIVLSDESKIFLAYLLEDEPNWSIAKIEDINEESIVIVEFKHYVSFMFGMPNDEVLRGHPLYTRGLRLYAAHIIQNSSWIRELERMNSIHEHHKPERFEKLKHFIFAFHDSTFECVTEGFEISIHEDSLESILPEMQKRLFSRFS